MTRRHCGLIFPPGTYQAPQFYWRGGDEFKEAEHLQSDYLQTKREHSKVKKELEEIQNEYREVNEALTNREEQAVALASSLGGASATTGENSRLNKEIAKLTVEISDIEEKITEASERTQPVYLAQLERERSQIYVAVERLTHDLESTQKEIHDLNQEYYSLLTSDEWMDANMINSQYQIINRERLKLRSEVNKHFEDQNYAKESKPDTSNRTKKSISSTANVAELLDQSEIYQNQLNSASHNRFMAQTTRKVLVATKLDIIAQLNTILSDLNLEEVNIDELKDKYLPDGPLTPTKRPATQLSSRGVKTARSIRRPLSKTGRM